MEQLENDVEHIVDPVADRAYLLKLRRYSAIATFFAVVSATIGYALLKG